MKKNTNDSNSKTNNTTRKKQTINKNYVFEIVKIKKPKNRKASVESDNFIYTYNINDKKSTSLKKIFNYHEISDLQNLYNGLNSKNERNFSENNYTIKCIFLDRHVKSFIKGEKSSEMTLDLIEKEEKSKIIDLYLIKSELISDNFKNNANNINFLQRKTYSSNSISNISNNGNLNNNINNDEKKLEKIKLLKEINNYINNLCLIHPENIQQAVIKNYTSQKILNLQQRPTTNQIEINNKNNANLRNQSSINNFSNVYQGEEVKSKISFDNLFYQFVNYFPQDFDCFEYEVIKILSSRMNFNDFSNIFLFLYDDLKKLRDTKTIELLKNKLKENINEDLTFLKIELKNFYEFRSNIINEFLGKKKEEEEWTEEKVINEIFLTSLIAEKLKNTMELDLTQNYIMGKNIQMIMSALKFNNFIWKINLNSNKIGDEGMFLLGRVLHYNNKITDLDISLNFLNDKSTGLLIKGIDCTFVNLQKINLSHNSGLTHLSGERIKELIELSPNLKFLNISRINLEKGIKKVMEGLLINKNVEELVCFATQLNDEILSDISRFFRYENDIRLKKINLSDNKFNGNSPIDLFNSMKNNCHLKELVMFNCKMENHIIDSFCEMLKINTCLEKVNFYNNELSSIENLKKILFIKKYHAFNRNIVNQINFEYENPNNDALISKNSLDKQASLNTHSKFEDMIFTDSQIRGGNQTNSNYLASNFIQNKDVNDVFGFWNTDNDCDKTLEDNSNEYRKKNKIISNYEDSALNMNQITTENDVKFEKSFKKMDCETNDKKNIFVQNKTLFNLDISKNKIKFILDEEFFDLLRNSNLVELDLSQNIEHDNSLTNNPDSTYVNFKEFIKSIKNLKILI